MHPFEAGEGKAFTSFGIGPDYRPSTVQHHDSAHLYIFMYILLRLPSPLVRTLGALPLEHPLDMMAQAADQGGVLSLPT